MRFIYVGFIFFSLILRAEEITPSNTCTVEEWEKFVNNHPAAKDKKSYRIYNKNTSKRVKDFYRINHKNQTLDFVLRKKQDYAQLNRKKMDIWEAFALLDQTIDESDPDLDLPQTYHLFQTAERLRKEGHPRWLILTGLIHDLGKILIHYGEPQWAVVGDTFPVGCAFSDKITFSEYFDQNPDTTHPIYQSKYGIYSPGCGLDKVHMSWGHDEYLYQVCKDHLPKEALFIIRYHSFYAAHRENDYEYLMNEQDREMLNWLKIFNRCDLYSKSAQKPDITNLLPYYKELVTEYLPEKLSW